MKRGIDGIHIGIGIVVFLLIIEKVFRIDGEIMSPIYGILMLVFLAAALISYLYIRSYAKRVGNIVELTERQLQIAQQAWTNNNIQNQFQILEIILKMRDKPQE